MLLVGAVAAGCGLFPDVSKFEGSPKPAGSPMDACAGWGAPQYLKAPAPATSAGFGSGLAARGSDLLVLAPVEGITDENVAESPEPAAECPSRTAPLDAYGTGRIHPFSHDGDTWRGGQLDIPGADQIVGVVPGQPFSMDPVSMGADFALVNASLYDGGVAIGVAGDTTGDPSSTYRGSVRFFQRTSPAAWNQFAELVEDETDATDGFGSSVDVFGTTLVVGAPGTGDNFEGAAYVYDIEDPARPVLVAGPLFTTTRQQYALFGAKVLASDAWIFVAAPGEAAAPDFGESGVGAVYAFRRDELHADPVPIRPPPGNAHSFGVSMLLDGNMLLVGAPGSDGCPGKPAFNAAGIIVRYEVGPSGTWEEKECVSAPGEQAGLFGWTMAMNDAWLVVGAPFSWAHAPTLVQGSRPLQQSTGAAAGLAYVFERTGGEFVPSCVLEAPNTDPCDNFGQAVAFGRDFLAIGAYGEDGSKGGTSKPDNLRMDSGAVYLYALPRAR